MATDRPAIQPLQTDLLPDIIEALHAWVALQPDPKPTRGEVIVYAMRDWLTGLGLLPFDDDPEEAN